MYLILYISCLCNLYHRDNILNIYTKLSFFLMIYIYSDQINTKSKFSIERSETVYNKFSTWKDNIVFKILILFY